MTHREGQTWVNSPELTRGSSPARPGTAEGVGIPPPVTKWPAEGSYVTLKIPRVEWCGQLGRGRPISMAASSKAAAGVRPCAGSGLRRANTETKALARHYTMWQARCIAREDQMVAGATPATSSSGDELRPWWNYGLEGANAWERRGERRRSSQGGR